MPWKKVLIEFYLLETYTIYKKPTKIKLCFKLYHILFLNALFIRFYHCGFDDDWKHYLSNILKFFIKPLNSQNYQCLFFVLGIITRNQSRRQQNIKYNSWDVFRSSIFEIC